MGYGPAAAIGASFTRAKRVLHVESDGRLTQSSHEFVTIAINNLPIESLVLTIEDYTSIRLTLRQYFKGRNMGCDANTGLAT